MSANWIVPTMKESERYVHIQSSAKFRAECVEIIIDHVVIFGPLFPVALI